MATPTDREQDEAIEVVSELYRAFAEGDHEALLGTLAEDVRWRQAGRAVPAAGEDRVGDVRLLEEVVRPIERDWEGFTEEVEGMVAADGTVVATGTYRGVHRRSGRALEAEFCHLWEVRRGRVQAFRQYTDTAAFARATEAGDGPGDPARGGGV